jgi:hypothetical protein
MVSSAEGLHKRFEEWRNESGPGQKRYNVLGSLVPSMFRGCVSTRHVSSHQPRIACSRANADDGSLIRRAGS